MNLSKFYRVNEKVLQGEHDTFTPLVMSSNLGFGRKCARFYSKLNAEIAEKRQQPYTAVCSCINRKVIFP